MVAGVVIPSIATMHRGDKNKKRTSSQCRLRDPKRRIRQHRWKSPSLPSLRDVADDGVVPRLDRRTARPRAAEMVLGGTLGPALASGRDRPLSADGQGSEAVARRTGEAAPGAG